MLIPPSAEAPVTAVQPPGPPVGASRSDIKKKSLATIAKITSLVATAELVATVKPVEVSVLVGHSRTVAATGQLPDGKVPS